VKKLVSNTIAVGLTLASRLSTPISRIRPTKTLQDRHGWLLELQFNREGKVIALLLAFARHVPEFDRHQCEA
jgi:hypothetical protein